MRASTLSPRLRLRLRLRPPLSLAPLPSLSPEPAHEPGVTGCSSAAHSGLFFARALSRAVLPH